MSATEIQNWMEYFTIYPFSQDREDIRIALIATILMNSQRAKKTDKVWKVEDFIPKYLEDEKETVIEKSIDIQEQEFEKFKAEYLEAKKLGMGDNN